ncbi:MAG: hypothetical protein GY906_27830 [bacterium]|nr:hypothetical protein [bacterium]
MVGKKASFDRDDAGWYVHNSVSVRDIYPVWRLPGGGVGKRMLHQDLSVAFRQATAYAQQRANDANAHLAKLETAYETWLDMKENL